MILDPLDPLALDRELLRIATRWQSFRRALRAGTGLDRDPFAGSREIAGRAAYDTVRALPASDPLREPLLAWIHRLMEQRINQAALSAATNALAIEPRVVHEPEYAQLTLAEMLKKGLAEPGRRRAWVEAFVQNAEPHSAAVALLWERRAEIARRLGDDGFDARDPAASEVARSAALWLEQTRDTAAEWRSHELAALIGHALGSEADRGWPAHLNLRTLVDFFRETRLFDGLPLDPGALPRPLAASSFLRALARLGCSFVDASRPKSLPFVVACDPRGLRRRTHGALLAGLPLTEPFARRVLGLSAGALRDQTRVIARVVLLASRSQALRVGLRAAALSGRAALENAFEEGMESSFGVVLPKASAGSVLRLHVDDAQRFAGLLLAASEAEQLTEAHDEDWFRNPRAIDQLRSEAALPPVRGVSPDALEAGARSLSRLLVRALG